MNSKKAVIIFSGGLDSTTVLAHAKAQGYECYALTFSYGQSLIVEVDASKELAQSMGVVEHKIMELNLALFKGSALTDAKIPIPTNQDEQNVIPVTYVPARNTIFLSIALAYAETINASDIFIGVNAVDYSGYPDCRPEYINAFNIMANLATKATVSGDQIIKIHTPLIDLSKAEIIKLGLQYNVDYTKTISCYQPNQYYAACGECSSCLQRKDGFIAAGIPDQTNYYQF